MADEYLASNEFPGDGVTTLYNVSFKGNRPDAGSGVVPYLDPADVKAQVITPATTSTGPIVVDVPIVYVGPNQFSVTPATPVGKITRIYRATQDEYALVNYQSLQTVGEADLDLSNRQVVFIVQEAHDLATRASLVANSANEVAYASTQRSLRVPNTDATIEPLPDVNGRKGKLVGFDSLGNPITIAPTSGSATDLALALADPADPAKGATLVGYNGSTVRAALDTSAQFRTDLANAAVPAKGASLVGYNGTTVKLTLDGINTSLAGKADLSALALATGQTPGSAMIGRNFQVVPNIAGLRLRLKTNPSKYCFVTGYTTDGDGGGGPYWYDSTDTTSTDNGGTIIVAADGGRWKLLWKTMALTVKQFGAVADDTTDSTLAIQAALNFAVANGIGEVWAVGKYRITDALVMNTGVFIQSIVLRGDGPTSQIRQTGAGKDAIRFATTTTLRNSGIKDITIYCEATAGHGINIEFACTVCFFTNVNVTVLNTTKSCYYGVWSGFANGTRGVFDTVWEGGDLYITPAHTTHAIDIVTNGTEFNENCFRNLRCSQSNTVQFFRIINVDNASYLTNNRFENINFEICKGGGMLVYNAKGWVLSNLTFWDTPSYTNHLIYFASNTGLGSIANTFIAIQRNGDSLSGGAKDIKFDANAAQDSIVINCFTPATSTPAYDWGNNRVVIHGLTLANETNIAQRVYANYDNMITARARVQTGTINILQSTNFASIVKNSPGNYQFNFLTPKPSADSYNAQVTLSAPGAALIGTVTQSAGFCVVVITNTSFAAVDGGIINLTITG